MEKGQGNDREGVLSRSFAISRRVLGSEMAKESQTAITALSANPIKLPSLSLFSISFSCPGFPRCLLHKKPHLSLLRLLNYAFPDSSSKDEARF